MLMGRFMAVAHPLLFESNRMHEVLGCGLWHVKV